ncbi:unnamed protein product [Lactuca saligna]|uniref:Reverse transcriptase zinc-binding domain-containing protein n=1 Tax=Lactuca saligna TaxID=75948 RepID=A0AA35YNX4_LACSI|nr:unnamed protein product [Lactuca saligna]
MFWHDRWIGDATLKESFPELYKLERKKRCKISERIKPGDISWDWKASPTLTVQLSEADTLLDLVCNFQLNSRRDEWICSISSDKVFHVDVLRSKIDGRNTLTPTGEGLINRIHEVPLKVNCFMWRASMDRIPTATALLKRGVQNVTSTCSYCELEDEDVNHVILRCLMAVKVWEWVIIWCGLGERKFVTIGELEKFLSQWGTCPIKQKNLISICSGTAWLIWKTSVTGSSRRFVPPLLKWRICSKTDAKPRVTLASQVNTLKSSFSCTLHF